MRFTLYPHDEDCERPPLEVTVETDLIKKLLANGQITPQEIHATLARAVQHIERILFPEADPQLAKPITPPIEIVMPAGDAAARFGG